MRRLVFSVFLFVSAFLFVSCSNEGISDGVDFYWKQTGCADPWGTNSNDSNKETEKALKEYLKLEGISEVNVKEFKNVESDAQLCEACHCLNGVRIIVEVSQKDSAKMEELEFLRL